MRGSVRRVLWNDRSVRPRLAWRLLGAVALYAVLAVGVLVAVRDSFGVLVALVTFGAGSPGVQAAARNVLAISIQAVIALVTVFLAGRFLDRRPFHDYGFRFDRDWSVDLGFGLLLGAALMTLVFAVELAAGWIRITGTFRIAHPGFGFWPWFVFALVSFVVIGVYEEVLARGFLLKNLAEGFTWFDRLGTTGSVAVAVVLTCVVFGAGHATNPNATAAGVAGIAVAAVMLAAGYVTTGELAIPIGVHTTWNFFQGPVYGFPVSGLDQGISLVAVDGAGEPLLTGGAFGPEAGLVGVLASLVGVAATLTWVRWRYGELRIAASVTTPTSREG